MCSPALQVRLPVFAPLLAGVNVPDTRLGKASCPFCPSTTAPAPAPASPNPKFNPTFPPTPLPSTVHPTELRILQSIRPSCISTVKTPAGCRLFCLARVASHPSCVSQLHGIWFHPTVPRCDGPPPMLVLAVSEYVRACTVVRGSHVRAITCQPSRACSLQGQEISPLRFHWCLLLPLSDHALCLASSALPTPSEHTHWRGIGVDCRACLPS